MGEREFNLYGVNMNVIYFVAGNTLEVVQVYPNHFVFIYPYWDMAWFGLVDVVDVILHTQHKKKRHQKDRN